MSVSLWSETLSFCRGGVLCVVAPSFPSPVVGTLCGFVADSMVVAGSAWYDSVVAALLLIVGPGLFSWKVYSHAGVLQDLPV